MPSFYTGLFRTKSVNSSQRSILTIMVIKKEEKPRHIADVVGKIIAQPDFTKAIEKVVADRKKQKPRLLKI